MPPNEPTVRIQAKPEAQVIAELVGKHLAPTTITFARDGDDKATVVVLPEGLKAHSIKPFLDEYLTRPERRKGTASLGDLDSFIGHVNRFKDDDSVIFSNPDTRAPSLTAVLDYHRKGSEGSPRFGQHRAVYSFPIADEWKAWKERNAVEMSQADFAAFLEDRIADVIDPVDPGPANQALFTKLGVSVALPSKLLELSKGMRVRVDSKIHESRNLSSGETQLLYATEHQDERGEALKVPGAFVIAIPVFRNGAPYKIAVRLRYRLRTAISWFFELYRTDLVFDDAFKEASKKAQTDTGLPNFVGTPE